jgi:hypothetical protein
LPVVGACFLSLGCQQARPARYPPDPLLVSKRPVESRAEPGLARPVACREPQAPERLVAVLPPHSENLPAEGTQHQPVSLRENSDER